MSLWAVVTRGLGQAALTYQLPFPLLIVGHTLSVLPAFRGYTDSWLVHLFVVFVAGFGGGMSSALLLQSPSTTAIGLFSRNELGLCYALTWWAYGYFPGGWVARAVDVPAVHAATKLARAVLRANTVVQRVNAAVKLHPGVVAAPLLLGTLGGCGGRLLTDAFGHCAGYTYGPTELSRPGYSLRSAALAASLQYLLVHVGGLLTSQQGLGLVTTLFVAHSLAADVTGRPCDYTAPLGWLFHKVTLIPVPGEVSAAATPATKGGGPARVGRRRSSAAAAGGTDEVGQPAAMPSQPSRRTTRRRGAAAARAG